QDVEMIHGTGRFVGPNDAVIDTATGERQIGFDTALISTGSYPRIPDWAPVDGKRVLVTRDCYDLEAVPEHMVVIGSGVT
ncbi:NADPH:quinone reductase, partial [Enterococcus hirae]